MSVSGAIPLAPGTRLGPYEVLEPIGSGGMGEVYRARDARLSRDVALKVPSGPLDEEARRLFTRETRAVAALSHPSILAIHDVGSDDARCWAVLELLEGETLRSRISRGALPWRRALVLAVEIAEGLAAAHAHGIVHRDVKPENVFLTFSGHAKLLDFGLAKPPPAPAPEDATAPELGLVAGTAGYMAPEQARGEGADTRSDVFAFGCLLYEMLTSHRAFPGASPAERLAAVFTEEPRDPSELAPVPAALCRIVSSCLEKRPAARFQDARDLVLALRLVEGSARARRRPPPLALAIAAAAAVLALALLGRGHVSRPSALPIAVLPFVHPAGDEDAAYLGDGLAEGLINTLAPLPGLHVLARTSAFTYRDAPDPAKAGRALHVKAVLTGSVRRHGDLLDVQADLLDAESGAELWGRRYPARPAADPSLALEIVREVAPVLKVPLSGDDERRLARSPTKSARAWDLYLKGRYEWNSRSAAGMAASIPLFEEALRSDPDLALAWAGLAESVELLAFYGARPPQELLPKARAAALRALSLDPELAEAEACAADIRYQFDWDWTDAERRFRHAIALNPNCATAHQWYSNLLSAAGRHDESFAEAEEARRIDPLDRAIATDVGLARYWARDFAGARSRLEKAAALDPAFPLARLYLGLATLRLGKAAEALAAFDEVRRAAPDEADPIALWGTAAARAGREDEVRAAVRAMAELASSRWVSAFPRAYLALGAGDEPQALDWLEKAAAERAGRLVYLKVEPAFDPLRKEPRFRAIVARVGIP